MPGQRCKWRSRYDTEYECNKPPLDDGFCILHSEKDDKDLEAFKEEVKNRKTTRGDVIDLKGCYFPKKFDSGYFRGYVFRIPVDFGEAKFSEEADFTGAKFSKLADFSWATFSEAVFSGAKFSKLAYFSGATFSEKADFNWVTFSEEAGFSEVTFSEEAGFSEVTFSEMAYFSGVTFSKEAYFGLATFSKEVDFIEATFSKADFSWAKFSKEAYFGLATFSEMAYFIEAKFSEEADFIEATFSEEANFGGATFSKAYFVATRFEKGAVFDRAEFRDRVFLIPSVIKEEEEEKEVYVHLGPGSSFQDVRFLGDVRFQRVDLSNCSFLHSNIDSVDFRYCEFAEAGGRKNVLRDELNADKDVEKNLEKKYEPVRRLYLELKRNFEDKRDWDKAGDFHYGEMECRRKMKGWWGRNIFSLEAAYYWASGYGERPWRASVVLTLLVFVVFPLLLSLDVLVPPLWSEKPFYFWNWVEDFKNSVWYSLEVATFTRVTRIGEAMKVAGWDKWILVSESIVVYIQIALFALALRRKVKR